MDCGLTLHSYWHEINADRYWIRHKDCLKIVNLEDGNASPCCERCFSVTDRHSVQKIVVKFVGQFHAARLLQKRLFCPTGEAEELVAELRDTTFGVNNIEFWNKILGMDNRASRIRAEIFCAQAKGMSKPPPEHLHGVSGVPLLEGACWLCNIQPGSLGLPIH